MACFLAPAATAIIATTIRKKINKNYHFDWLILMLWGGTIMLILDHLINGEITIYPPFFTKGISEMLPEIIKVGIPMVLAVFFVWVIMVIVANRKESLTIKPTTPKI